MIYKFANDWIRTLDFECMKWMVYQLCHQQQQCPFEFAQNMFKTIARLEQFGSKRFRVWIHQKRDWHQSPLRQPWRTQARPEGSGKWNPLICVWNRRRLYCQCEWILSLFEAVMLGDLDRVVECLLSTDAYLPTVLLLMLRH